MTSSPDQWYVQYDSLSYGPYTHVQMQGFVEEGRVIAGSLITTDPARGFFRARDFPAFAQWSAAPQAPPPEPVQQPLMEAPVEPVAQPANQAAPKKLDSEPLRPILHLATGQSVGQSRGGQSRGGQSRGGQYHTASHTAQTPNMTAQAPKLSPAVLLVMAEIRSDQGMPFLHALQAHGTAQRIGDSVWLLRTKLSADTLRSTLSRTLSKQDRLFILDSFNNKTAWFNIGADMDGRIRKLWEDV